MGKEIFAILAGYIIELIKYRGRHEEIINKLLDDTGCKNMPATGVEEIRQEGIDEGLKNGKLEGKPEIAGSIFYKALEFPQ